MQPMRRILPRPTLRMADGGVITRWAQNIMRPTQTRLRAADTPAPAPMPMMTPAPAPTAAPVTAENPAGIRFADGGNYRKGSMDGGRVVGSGTGVSDSVPAMYSNGEYVLPADTAKAIGHDTLDEIKDATHTPAHLQGKQHGQTATLRGPAEMGESLVSGGLRGSPRDVPGFESAGRGVSLRLADGGIPGIDVLERPFTSADSRAFATDPGPGNPNVGRAAPVPPAAAVAPAAAPVAPAAEPAGRIASLRSGVNDFFGAGKSAGSVGGAFKSVAEPFVKAGGSLLRAGAKLTAPATLATAASGGFNTDTEQYAKRFGLENTEPGVARDLGVRALGVASDVGDNLTFGLAKKYLYRDGQNGELAPTSPTAPVVTPSIPAGTSAAGAGRGVVNPPLASSLPDQQPTGPALRGQGGTEVDGAPGVRKFVQNGKTLYSNVTGPDNDKLMSGKPGVSVVPGMSREAIDSALGGLSASQVSGDNAIRAANLRDGVDMERGTQGGKAARDEQQLQDLALSPAGTNGRTFAQKQLGLRMTDATTQRGQDVTDRGNLLQSETSLRNNRATAKAAAQKADQEQRNSDRSFSAGRDDARFTQREKSEKDLTESILQSHTSTVDGKSVIDQKAANQTRQAFDTMIAKQIQDLQRSGAPEDLARAKNLADNKVNAIDPATRQKVIAAVKLMNKVGADGSNLNPFKPDHMGTSDPRDFMDLKKNPSGDYVTRNGKVIPARYFATQDADRFGGVPTNEFDILKGQ